MEKKKKFTYCITHHLLAKNKSDKNANPQQKK